MAILMRAARLDPRSGIIKVNIAELFVDQGSEQEAERWLSESVTTQEPFWRPGNVQLSSFQLERGKPVEVAVRNRDYVRQRSAEYPSYMLWGKALLDMGAWKEASEVVETMVERNFGTSTNYSTLGLEMSWDHFKTLYDHRLARATGQWEEAESLARKQWSYYQDNAALWPELPYYMANQSAATLAQVDLREGSPDIALARVETAYPEISKEVNRVPEELLDPFFLRVALLKQLGRTQEAEQLLQQHLSYLGAEERRNRRTRIGWSRFVVLALSGEHDLALEELDRIADTPYHHQWYDLNSYSFDPDYAAVLGDPRYVAIFSRIRARADRLREEYLRTE